MNQLCVMIVLNPQNCEEMKGKAGSLSGDVILKQQALRFSQILQSYLEWTKLFCIHKDGMWPPIWIKKTVTYAKISPKMMNPRAEVKIVKL